LIIKVFYIHPIVFSQKSPKYQHTPSIFHDSWSSKTTVGLPAEGYKWSLAGCWRSFRPDFSWIRNEFFAFEVKGQKWCS